MPSGGRHAVGWEVWMPIEGEHDVPEPRRSADEMIKLIRKLRWIGQLEEAEKVRLRLEAADLPPADGVATRAGGSE